MDVTLKGLRAFLAIARHRSFTRAAGLLHVTQPALTVQIRQLEVALGLRLLDRTPQGVEPTAAGLELARVLEVQLRDLDHTLENVRDLAARRRGTVRLAALPSVASSLLPSAMLRMRERHPELRVQLQEAVTGRIHDMVRAEMVDIGIASGPPPGPDLAREPLFQDHLLAILPADHPLASRRRIPLEALARESLLLLESNTSVWRVLDDAFAAKGLRLTPFQQAVHTSTLVGMAQAGLGIALLPSTAVELRIAPELARRRLQPDLAREIVVVHRTGRSLSPAAAALIDALRESVAA
ncbi:LysR family transcriptional regulator [Roseomonas xinghualingensis]|uniref:LysR family transcriptional regulator n=1 Tax=Roseomonas xinghualingensis TaxID=2986475 RepID=UPI0021F1E633|nr:LysR family transcriptional regulator [Roseomonas sp. SXEYE001]MCV4206960.1 LysR family transcriptional regulator [Roseomonas sp. SXEYE001]